MKILWWHLFLCKNSSKMQTCKRGSFFTRTAAKSEKWNRNCRGPIEAGWMTSHPNHFQSAQYKLINHVCKEPGSILKLSIYIYKGLDMLTSIAAKNIFMKKKNFCNLSGLLCVSKTFVARWQTNSPQNSPTPEQTYHFNIFPNCDSCKLRRETFYIWPGQS